MEAGRCHATRCRVALSADRGSVAGGVHLAAARGTAGCTSDERLSTKAGARATGDGVHRVAHRETRVSGCAQAV